MIYIKFMLFSSETNLAHYGIYLPDEFLTDYKEYKEYLSFWSNSDL